MNSQFNFHVMIFIMGMVHKYNKKSSDFSEYSDRIRPNSKIRIRIQRFLKTYPDPQFWRQAVLMRIIQIYIAFLLLPHMVFLEAQNTMRACEGNLRQIRSCCRCKQLPYIDWITHFPPNLRNDSELPSFT